jgi:phosphopantothenoylcysteine decarboxylase/phosphopantothenate--cysteine ligase
MGADVTLVAGRTSLSPPAGVKVIRVASAQQMLEAVTSVYDDMDIVVKSAAVADYRAINVSDQKIKKSGEKLVLELERTTDILETLGQRKKHQFLVGFAAETEQIEHYAMDKLRRKHCDLIVANDVSKDGSGFNGDTNIVQVFASEGLVESMPLMSKREVASRLLELIAARLPSPGGRGE